jgi:branched-subunit amino acid aminotransferase/4-amino-4-deoxychorismate lyase
MDVYLNGQMLPPEQAHLRADDAGLLHAVGLFETMAAAHGRVFRLQPHLDRLAESAKALGLARELDVAELAEGVRKTLEHNGLEQARIRLTVTAGPLIPAGEGQAPQRTVLIQPSPPTQYDPSYFERGITAVIAQAAANPFDPMGGHKTLSYWPRLRSLRQAAEQGAGEAIWLNISNHVASGAISNLLAVKDGQLITPFARGEEVKDALPAPVLPGIMRQAVLELAEGAGIPVTRRMLSVEELLEADEVFLTNSSWLVLPVTQIEQKQIGGGKVGPITHQLRQELMETMEQETRSAS